ncbi:MAG: LacI family DNA-binding transcriptional regulator [Thermomicrobiales bacterium]
MAALRPRQKDVAALAGVSQAIVSAVINGRANGAMRISQETEQRIWDAVRQLGYVPDPIARKLAGGQNRLLGVFTYEPTFPVQPQTSNYPFLVGVEQEAVAQNYNLLLFTQANAPDGRRTIYTDGVNNLRLADGAILFGHQAHTDELRQLLAERYPFVFIGRRQVPGHELASVVAAHVESSADLVGRVLDLGHRRLAYLRSPVAIEPEEDREEGFWLAHQRRGLPLDERLIARVRPDEVTPALVAALFIAGVTAIVTEQTSLADQARVAARELGQEAPRDFSLAALGDSMTLPLDPELTTLVIPRQEIGARAVRLLVRRLAQPADSAPEQLYLPCAIATGRTLAAPTVDRP